MTDPQAIKNLHTRYKLIISILLIHLYCLQLFDRCIDPMLQLLKGWSGCHFNHYISGITIHIKKVSLARCLNRFYL